MDLTVDMFKPEMAEALRSFDKYVVCIAKTPEDCEGALQRLVEKAIKTAPPVCAMAPPSTIR